ncbi:dienelactone hydrolase [Chytriomyces sp. MP71]|nr:dienelactone hydrolase [Chytriomyces sp. MP71]
MSSVACCGGTRAPEVLATTLKGHEQMVGGHVSYVVSPSGTARPRTAIVFATDIFGFKLLSSRLVADRFAEKGHLVVMPDLFKGTEPPASLMTSISALTGTGASILTKVVAFLKLLYYFVPFRLRNSQKKSAEIIEASLKALRENHGVNKVAIVGYCWGGGVSVKISHKSGAIDAIAPTHAGGLTFPGDVEKITVPAYFVCPEKDMGIKEPQFKVIQEVQAQQNAAIANADLKHAAEWFEGVVHGFAVRGDDADAHTKAMRDRAFEHTAAFFARVFKH